MPLTPLRKKLNMAFGALMLGGLFFALAPMLFSPVELWWFCRGLTPGLDEASIRNLAMEKGYQFAAAQDSPWYVYDYASLGHFACELQMDKRIVIKATYILQD